MLKLTFLIIALMTGTAHAYVPSVPAVLKEIFDRRRVHTWRELKIRHRIAVKRSQLVTFTETIVYGQGQSYFSIKPDELGKPVKAILQDKAYNFGGKYIIPTRSEIFRSYFFSYSAEA